MVKYTGQSEFRIQIIKVLQSSEILYNCETLVIVLTDELVVKGSCFSHLIHL